MSEPAGRTWDVGEALAAMARVQVAIGVKGLSPFAPPLYELGGRVVAALLARDLGTVTAACGEMIEAAGRLPTGRFPWKPGPVPEPRDPD